MKLMQRAGLVVNIVILVSLIIAFSGCKEAVVGKAYGPPGPGDDSASNCAANDGLWTPYFDPDFDPPLSPGCCGNDDQFHEQAIMNFYGNSYQLISDPNICCGNTASGSLGFSYGGLVDLGYYLYGSYEDSQIAVWKENYQFVSFATTKLAGTDTLLWFGESGTAGTLNTVIDTKFPLETWEDASNNWLVAGTHEDKILFISPYASTSPNNPGTDFSNWDVAEFTIGTECDSSNFNIDEIVIVDDKLFVMAKRPLQSYHRICIYDLSNIDSSTWDPSVSNVDLTSQVNYLTTGFFTPNNAVLWDVEGRTTTAAESQSGTYDYILYFVVNRTVAHEEDLIKISISSIDGSSEESQDYYYSEYDIPKGVAIDDYGFVYVTWTDGIYAYVDVFDANLNFVTSYSTTDFSEFQTSPSDIEYVDNRLYYMPNHNAADTVHYFQAHSCDYSGPPPCIFDSITLNEGSNCNAQGFTNNCDPGESIAFEINYNEGCYDAQAVYITLKASDDSCTFAEGYGFLNYGELGAGVGVYDWEDSIPTVPYECLGKQMEIEEAKFLFSGYDTSANSMSGLFTAGEPASYSCSVQEAWVTGLPPDGTCEEIDTFGTCGEIDMLYANVTLTGSQCDIVDAVIWTLSNSDESCVVSVFVDDEPEVFHWIHNFYSGNNFIESFPIAFDNLPVVCSEERIGAFAGGETNFHLIRYLLEDSGNISYAQRVSFSSDSQNVNGGFTFQEIICPIEEETVLFHSCDNTACDFSGSGGLVCDNLADGYDCSIAEEIMTGCAPENDYCVVDGTVVDSIIGGPVDDGRADLVAVTGKKNIAFCDNNVVNNLGSIWIDCDTASVAGPKTAAYQCDGLQVGDWNDYDICFIPGEMEASMAGEDNVGEYSDQATIECCGDDEGEYLVWDDYNGKYMCCDNPSDVIVGGVCTSSECVVPSASISAGTNCADNRFSDGCDSGESINLSFTYTGDCSVANNVELSFTSAECTIQNMYFTLSSPIGGSGTYQENLILADSLIETSCIGKELFLEGMTIYAGGGNPSYVADNSVGSFTLGEPDIIDCSITNSYADGFFSSANCAGGDTYGVCEEGQQFYTNANYDGTECYLADKIAWMYTNSAGDCVYSPLLSYSPNMYDSDLVLDLESNSYTGSYITVPPVPLACDNARMGPFDGGSTSVFLLREHWNNGVPPADYNEYSVQEFNDVPPAFDGGFTFTSETTQISIEHVDTDYDLGAFGSYCGGYDIYLDVPLFSGSGSACISWADEICFYEEGSGGYEYSWNGQTITINLPVECNVNRRMNTRITVTDYAGSSDSVFFDFNSVPFISSIEPSQCSLSEGCGDVTIQGFNFIEPEIEVYLNDTSVPGASISNTQITFTDSGDYVTNPGTIELSINNTVYGENTATAITYSNLGIQSIQPNHCLVDGCENVTIIGFGFNSYANVEFDNLVAPYIQNLSDTILNVTAPAHVAAGVDVKVSDGVIEALLETGFYYINDTPAPNITGLGTTVGSTNGGEWLYVYGTEFYNGSEPYSLELLFDTTPALGIEYFNDTELYVQAPAHTAGTVSVTVINPDGEENISENAYTYVAPEVPDDGGSPVFSKGGSPLFSKGGSGGSSLQSYENEFDLDIEKVIVKIRSRRAPTVQVTEVSPSTLEKKPAYELYKVFDIDSSVSYVEQGVIEFKVPKSWMKQNNIDYKKVRMYHYTGTSWQELPTAWYKTDNVYNRYNATTTRYSLFAITGQKGTVPLYDDEPEDTDTNENEAPEEDEPAPPEPTCFDSILNQDEIDVDCGGICSPCEEPTASFMQKILESSWFMYAIAGLILIATLGLFAYLGFVRHEFDHVLGPLFHRHHEEAGRQAQQQQVSPGVAGAVVEQKPMAVVSAASTQKNYLEQAEKFVVKARDLGLKDEEIKSRLRAAGWKEQDINAAIFHTNPHGIFSKPAPKVQVQQKTTPLPGAQQKQASPLQQPVVRRDMEELSTSVANLLRQGKTKPQIKILLERDGWRREDIERVLQHS
ncbi:IPT/TIG domain-containing protein [Candidatus Woesearchaeota archaeon]|nr:IPT/TIG domain-containing protein [Candidatus Woesearchaeota archaeon]